MENQEILKREIEKMKNTTICIECSKSNNKREVPQYRPPQNKYQINSVSSKNQNKPTNKTTKINKERICR